MERWNIAEIWTHLLYQISLQKKVISLKYNVRQKVISKIIMVEIKLSIINMPFSRSLINKYSMKSAWFNWDSKVCKNKGIEKGF